MTGVGSAEGALIFLHPQVLPLLKTWQAKEYPANESKHTHPQIQGNTTAIKIFTILMQRKCYQ